MTEVSEFSDVVVLDVSPVVSRGFNKSIAADGATDSRVHVIDSVYQFAKVLHDIKKNSGKEIVFLNEVRVISYGSFLCMGVFNYLFRRSDTKIIELYNGGIPLYYPIDVSSENDYFGWIRHHLSNLSSLSEFNSKIYRAFFCYLSSLIFSPIVTHRVVAGKQWEEYCKKLNASTTCNPKIIYAHCPDQSLYNQNRLNNSRMREETVSVFIDSAGPAFSSDSALIKRKVPFTSENWYPALVNLFSFIENALNCDVIILGHYKSKFGTFPSCYEGREVLYGKTEECIASARLVITRNSSAISYAVLHEKPVLFVCSDELLCDPVAMRDINGLADMLGSFVINVDRSLKSINFESLMRINVDKYRLYRDNVLTSNVNGKTNAIIIRDEVFE